MVYEMRNKTFENDCFFVIQVRVHQGRFAKEVQVIDKWTAEWMSVEHTGHPGDVSQHAW